MSLPTKGSFGIGAVNTSTGFCGVTFTGKSCKSGDGDKMFNNGQFHSASANCHHESGGSDWGLFMQTAGYICDYINGVPLPRGITVYH